MKYKEKIKRHFMKNPANKNEIVETARQRASIAQKTELTMRKQKTSVNATTNQKMGQQSQEKAIAVSDQKNQRQVYSWNDGGGHFRCKEVGEDKCSKSVEYSAHGKGKTD